MADPSGANDKIHFGMKTLGVENWCRPDIPKHFPGFTEEVWVSMVMEPKLIDTVPESVVRLFEVARGSVLYGWFFYPLLTLASEQLHRVQEASVRERCKLAGIPIETLNRGKLAPRRFAVLIRELSARGIIPPDSVHLWEGVRKLRNASSHPKNQMIIVPGDAAASVEATAREINQLFSTNPDFFSFLGKRIRGNTGLDQNPERLPLVVGIDVGDIAKGFHLVALRNTEVVAVRRTADSAEVANWCSELGAALVAVDAPSGWSMGGPDGLRKAERILRELQFSYHATPTREQAEANDFYAWMLNGERLYAALQKRFPLFVGREMPTPFCFETYPYLATCAYAGRRLQAADKRTDRRDIIRAAGISDQSLTNIDYVDAAICALVAFSVSCDYCVTLGDEAEGFILCAPLH